MAANNKGIQLVQELIQEYSLRVVQAYMHYIQARVGGRHSLFRRCVADSVYPPRDLSLDLLYNTTPAM